MTMAEVVAASLARFGDVPSSSTKIDLNSGHICAVANQLNMPSLLPADLAARIEACFFEIDMTAIRDDALHAYLATRELAKAFALKQDKRTVQDFIDGLGGHWKGELTMAERISSTPFSACRESAAEGGGIETPG